MITREDTVQHWDPVGALAARSVTHIGCAGMVVYVVVVTLLSFRDIDDFGIAILGIGMVAAAAILIAIAASPLRAPVVRGVHIAAMGLGMFGLAFNAASTWQGNSFIRDDWGAPVLGLISLMMVPYRPPREIAVLGVVAAVFAGCVALLQLEVVSTDLPPAMYVIVSTTPVLAMSLGGAAFASTVLQTIQRWNSRASSAVRALATERKTGLTRSVQQDRVTILNREVVPFFAAILERGELADGDRARASNISNSIRRVMVAEVDRTWLDLVVEQVATTRGVDREPVRDPERLAARMITDERTALRAAIVAMADHPAFIRDRLTVTVERTTRGCAGTIRADFTDSGARADLAPYLAVLRVVFSGLQADLVPPTLTVRFSYDNR